MTFNFKMKPTCSVKHVGLLALMVAGTATYIFLADGGERFSDRQPKRPRYLVSSSQCQIPDIDPFDPSIMAFVQPKEGPFECSLRPPLTYTSRHEGRVQLRIATNVTSQYVELAQAQNFQCCYSPIVRETDKKNTESACVEFSSSVALKKNVQHVYVTCVNRVTLDHVYTNVHAVVQARDDLHSKTSQGQRPRMNVVVLGIDSMSRLSLMRNMPKTVKLLRSNSWIELQGYNRIGDEKLPNLVALLTGLGPSQASAIGCLRPNATGYDRCPFLWHDFQRRGYVTAYAEDEADCSTFHDEAPGFDKPPTDFYLHPLMVEAHAKMPAVHLGGFVVCMGETSAADLVLGHASDLLDAYRSDLFAVIWLNNFSHDDDSLPAAMDETMERFFGDLQTSGALDTTMFVFLSDRGNRFGPIRLTNVGWFEERLPFAFVSVPPRFREGHAEAFANLEANGNRLTSPFDVHLTLRDVVDDSIGKPGNGSVGCRTCGSLFNPVKEDRSCAEAGIPDHWCTCLPRKEIPTSSQPVASAVSAAVAHVNALLSSDAKVNQTGHCALFRVAATVRAELVETTVTEAARFNDYSVVFTVAPGGFDLEATVRHWLREGPEWFEVLGKVSRVSAMFGESCKWVTDQTVEIYCFCL